MRDHALKIDIFSSLLDVFISLFSTPHLQNILEAEKMFSPHHSWVILPSNLEIVRMYGKHESCIIVMFCFAYFGGTVTLTTMAHKLKDWIQNLVKWQKVWFLTEKSQKMFCSLDTGLFWHFKKDTNMSKFYLLQLKLEVTWILLKGYCQTEGLAADDILLTHVWLKTIWLYQNIIRYLSNQTQMWF